MAIPGETLEGIFDATEFLVRPNLEPRQLPDSIKGPIDVGRRVVVIGGGDTSMDCVRTALRLGAEGRLGTGCRGLRTPAGCWTDARTAIKR